MCSVWHCRQWSLNLSSRRHLSHGYKRRLKGWHDWCTDQRQLKSSYLASRPGSISAASTGAPGPACLLILLSLENLKTRITYNLCVCACVWGWGGVRVHIFPFLCEQLYFLAQVRREAAIIALARRQSSWSSFLA